MKKIALEEAMIQPGTINLVPDHQNHPEFKEALPKLLEIGEKRFADMDASGISLSILSVTTPGLQGLNTREGVLEIAKDWNDYLVTQVNNHPDRLKAFCCIPTIDADMAVKELERVIENKAFVGCMINGFDDSDGGTPKYLDAHEFNAMWALLEKHNFPIYIHPRGVPDTRITTYNDFNSLKGSTWGFHIETGEHVLRLCLSGVFDRFPKLKLIIGHMGEMLPFWAWRIDHRTKMEGWDKIKASKRSITDYLRNNIWITTSGYFHTPALQHAISTVGIDRVLFSVDYPYEDSKQASDWLESIPYNEEEKEKIAFKNAEKLLSL